MTKLLRGTLAAGIAVLVAVAVAFAAASYPTAIKSFTTKNVGDTIQAAHVNDVQDEIVAIETALLNGTQHNLKPLTTATYDLGTTSLRWRSLFAGLGTITTDRQAIDVTGTWNAAGVTFTAIKADITNTASAAASLLIDLQVGSASQFKVSKAGLLTIAGNLVLATGGTINSHTVPNVAADTFALLAATQTFTGQNTFSNATAPIIAAKIGPSSTQQHTLPAVASDTIALLAATQTFSNKTINSLVTDNSASRITGVNRFRMLQSMARAYWTGGGAQTIATATWTAVQFNIEAFDTDTLHDTVTNNTRFTAQIAGKYMVTGWLAFPSNSTGFRACAITINAAAPNTGNDINQVHANHPAVSGATTVVSCTGLLQLAATDYVEFFVYQDSGGGLVIGDQSMSIIYVGE